MKITNKKHLNSSIVYLAMVVLVVSISFLYSCNSSDLDNKNNDDLVLLESLKNLSNLKSQNFVSINKHRDYFSYAQNGKYSDYAKKMHDAIGKVTKGEKVDKVKYKQDFFKKVESINKPVCFNEEPSEVEVLIYKELAGCLQGKELEERLSIVKKYFDYIQNNVCDDLKKDRLLYTIEILNLIYNNFDNKTRLKSSNINSIGGIPILKSANEYGGVLLTDCQHACMERKLNDMNFVDWTAAAISPSAYFGWMLASCIYECL